MLHVDEGQLHAYLDGELESVQPGAVALLEAHVAECPVCAARLAQARHLRDTTSGILRAAEPARVQLRSFDRLGGGAPPRRREVPNHRRMLQRRATALAWAASLVAALGIGWLARDLQFSRDQALVTREMQAIGAPVALSRSARSEADLPRPEEPSRALATPAGDSAPPEEGAGAPGTGEPSTIIPVVAAAPAGTPRPRPSRSTPAPAGPGTPGEADALQLSLAQSRPAPRTAEVAVVEVEWHSQPLAAQAVVTSGAVALDACAPTSPADRDAADAVLLTAVAHADASSAGRTATGYATASARTGRARAEAEHGQLVELRDLAGPRSAEIEELLGKQAARHAIVVPQRTDPACHPPPAGTRWLEPGAPVLLRAWLRPPQAWISGRPTFDVLRASP
jgi:hypothetical protein